MAAANQTRSETSTPSDGNMGGASRDTPLRGLWCAGHPQAVRGIYRAIKWIVLAVALCVYYLLPFLRWDRGPDAPDQAVLFDLLHERLYVFSIEIGPRDVFHVVGLLIVAAAILFLINAFAGRIWCGYLCPQTVWTDLFYAIARIVGAIGRRRSAWAGEVVKHAIWLAVAWWTGGAWLLYFMDAPTLVHDLVAMRASALVYSAIGVLTVTTYVMAGIIREKVCTQMCPLPRIQAALNDEHALAVTYRFDRGEPRIPPGAAQDEQRGDCIDCGRCAAVCPMRIDIRDGLQTDCIQCGLCIDACDSVMNVIGRQPRLIAYDTQINVRRRQKGEAALRKPLRARTAVFAAVIVVAGSIVISTFSPRQSHSRDGMPAPAPAVHTR